MKEVQYDKGDNMPPLTQPAQILQLVMMIIPLFMFHELAHAWMALRLGDTTAKDQGRLTINPLKHIDWLGLLLIVLVGFGWAKPVMINPENLKNKKRDMALIALAGPLVNFILALALIFASVTHINIVGSELYFLSIMARFSIMLGVFNMLPIPPLDGSKVLAALLPDDLYEAYKRYEGFGMFVFLILVFTGILRTFIVPMIDAIFWWMVSIFI